jgi:hypothetical protein
MARTKISKEERARRARARQFGVKRALAVMWTKTDHARALCKQREIARNMKKPYKWTWV